MPRGHVAARVRETTPVDVPEVKYARSGDVSIAYQVIGDGALDVVLVPDWVSNLVWAWHTPYWRNFYERLGSFARLIVFDKRGTGLSDRPRFFPDLETRPSCRARRSGERACGDRRRSRGLLDGVALCGDLSGADA